MFGPNCYSQLLYISSTAFIVNMQKLEFITNSQPSRAVLFRSDRQNSNKYQNQDLNLMKVEKASKYLIIPVIVVISHFSLCSVYHKQSDSPNFVKITG